MVCVRRCLFQQVENDFFIFGELIKDYIGLMGPLKVRVCCVHTCGCALWVLYLWESSAFADLRASLATGVYMVHGTYMVNSGARSPDMVS